MSDVTLLHDAAADAGADPAPGFWRGVGSLLTDAALLVRSAGVGLLWLILIAQLVIVLIAAPAMRWLFQQLLHSAGMTGLDFGTLQLQRTSALTIALLVVLVFVALSVVSLQFSALVLMLAGAQRGDDAAPRRVRRLTADLVGVWRKLLRPSSLPLIAYLFVFLPLSGFGFASAFTRGISIPLFVSDELNKSWMGAAILAVVLFVIGCVNLRWSLTMPLFALTPATGSQAIRTSQRLTRGASGNQLMTAVASIMLSAAVVVIVLAMLSLLPTMLSDRLWPAASPIVAALSFGAAQIIGMLLGGLVVAGIAGVLLAYLRPRHPEIGADAPEDLPRDRCPRARRRGPVLFGVATVIAAGALGVASIPAIAQLEQGGRTLVISHRGFSPAGVENTISGLDAAAELGVDAVEIDVMQARDGGFVVVHDPELSRLTGRAAWVKDLTVAELREMTVRNSHGVEDRIPGLAEFITRAAELDMTLLIEIKLSGAETSDHVDRLVTELEDLDALERHMYHSLDAPSVERLKQLHPDLVVGYTMAFAAEDVPRTSADLIVVEQWTATEHMQRSAERAGLGFMVWTVNDAAGIREHLRRDAGGIITDRPDLVREEQNRISQEEGLTPALEDALRRFFAS